MYKLAWLNLLVRCQQRSVMSGWATVISSVAGIVSSHAITFQSDFFFLYAKLHPTIEINKHNELHKLLDSCCIWDDLTSKVQTAHIRKGVIWICQTHPGVNIWSKPVYTTTLLRDCINNSPLFYQEETNDWSLSMHARGNIQWTNSCVPSSKKEERWSKVSIGFQRFCSCGPVQRSVKRKVQYLLATATSGILPGLHHTFVPKSIWNVFFFGRFLPFAQASNRCTEHAYVGLEIETVYK
jgi:hypothetical protein